MNRAWLSLRKAVQPQFVRYALCGAFATAVDALAFFVAAWRFLPALAPDDPLVRMLHLQGPFADETVRAINYLINRVIAFFVSNLVAYVTNVWWVFERGRHRRDIEVTLFYAVSAFSLVAGAGLGWTLIRLAGCSTTVAYLGNITASILINYACRKYVVFKG